METMGRGPGWLSGYGSGLRRFESLWKLFGGGVGGVGGYCSGLRRFESLWKLCGGWEGEGPEWLRHWT